MSSVECRVFNTVKALFLLLPGKLQGKKLLLSSHDSRTLGRQGLWEVTAPGLLPSLPAQAGQRMGSGRQGRGEGSGVGSRGGEAVGWLLLPHDEPPQPSSLGLLFWSVRVSVISRLTPQNY